MNCQNCGAELKTYQRFCPACGKKTEKKKSKDKSMMTSIINSLPGGISEDELDFLQIVGEDEELIFQTYRRGSLIDNASSNILVGAVFSFAIFLPYVLTLPSLAKMILFNSIFLTVVFMGLLLIALYPLTKGLKNYMKIKRYTGLSRKQLKHYLVAIIFTDKHYIAKFYRDDNFDFSIYGSDIVKQERDVLAIKIKNIHLRYSKTNIYNLINIEVFLELLEDAKHSFNLNMFSIQLSEFEKLLDDFEKKLQINIEQLEDGSGIIRFR